jgi:hypothetical protein
MKEIEKSLKNTPLNLQAKPTKGCVRAAKLTLT